MNKKYDDPVKYALDLLKGKWRIYIIWQLAKEDVMRFNSLKRELYGISDTMLSQTLKEMEKEKLICRKNYNTIPPKVEYSLTNFGKKIIPIFHILIYWVIEEDSSKFSSFYQKVDAYHLDLKKIYDDFKNN